MAVLQTAQFTLEIFICPYHISFVVAMYAVAVAKDLLRYGLNTPPNLIFLNYNSGGGLRKDPRTLWVDFLDHNIL